MEVQNLENIKENETFGRYLRRLKYSNNTVSTYTNYYNNIKGTKELKQQDINNFIDKFNHTIARSFLKVYLRFLTLDKKLVIPPLSGRKKHSTLRYLTKEEVYQLAHAAKDLSRNGLRDYLIITLLFETGLRVSELCSLRKESFDFDNNLIKGVGKGNKEFNNIMFSDITKPLLYQFVTLLEPNERLFRISRFEVLKIIKLAAKDIFPDRKITPHTLRHSTATYLKCNGMDLKDIQYYLRHSRLETTSIYADVDNSEFKKKWNDVMNV